MRHRELDALKQQWERTPLSNSLHLVHEQSRFGNATAEHDHVGVKRVDECRSRPAEMTGRLLEGCLGQQITIVSETRR